MDLKEDKGSSNNTATLFGRIATVASIVFPGWPIFANKESPIPIWIASYRGKLRYGLACKNTGAVA